VQHCITGCKKEAIDKIYGIFFSNKKRIFFNKNWTFFKTKIIASSLSGVAGVLLEMLFSF